MFTASFWNRTKTGDFWREWEHGAARVKINLVSPRADGPRAGRWTWTLVLFVDGEEVDARAGEASSAQGARQLAQGTAAMLCGLRSWDVLRDALDVSR